MVMGDTVQRPGGDAAVVRIHGTNRGLAIATDCTPRYCFADPRTGGAQAVAEVWRNLTAAGAKPLAITDNLNFGSPERPEIMGQFVECVAGIGEACRALDFPVVSGNVSLYNETSGVAILPTPAIGGVGLIEDLGRTATPAFKRDGETIILIGETRGHLGCSAYLRDICGIDAPDRAAGAPPPVDLHAERRNGDFVRTLITDKLVSACHDVSDGGIYVALAEMAIAGRIGARITPPKNRGEDLPIHAWLFGEDQARYVVTAARAEDVYSRAKRAAVPAVAVGTTGGASLTVTGADAISLAALAEAQGSWLLRYMAS